MVREFADIHDVLSFDFFIRNGRPARPPLPPGCGRTGVRGSGGMGGRGVLRWYAIRI